MSNRTFVLGADDPEMSAIASLLSLAGEKWEVAKTADGVRVNPGTAYKVASPVPNNGQVWVECAPADWLAGVNTHRSGAIRVDHHRAGDPGFGAPPEKFWEASSIGQVFDMVRGRYTFVQVFGRFPYEQFSDDWPVCTYGGCGPMSIVAVEANGTVMVNCNCDGGWHNPSGHEFMWPLIAAADHCLAAAYAGKCPGVDPDALLKWRLESRAVFQKKDPADLLIAVNAAIEVLKEAPASPLGESVADLRDRHTDELPEASCRLGIGYLATIKDRDGRTKIVLGGCGEGSVPGTEPVRIFKEVWAPAQGLVEIYGDPVRGFAGAYVHDCGKYAITDESECKTYCSFCRAELPY